MLNIICIISIMNIEYELRSDGKGLSFRIDFQGHDNEVNSEDQKEFLDAVHNIGHLNDDFLLNIFTKGCKYIRFCKKIDNETENPVSKKKKMTCAVCLDSVDTSSTESVTTECGHVYHRKCILQAVSVDVKCPLCRTSLGD